MLINQSSGSFGASQSRATRHGSSVSAGRAASAGRDGGQRGINILEFACLRGGFTPAELGLPEEVLRNARSRPLKGIKLRYDSPLYRCAFNEGPAYQKLPAKNNRRGGPGRGRRLEHPKRHPSLLAKADRAETAEERIPSSTRLHRSKLPNHKVGTSEITPVESERSGIWEGEQVRLAEAHALQMRGAK